MSDAVKTYSPYDPKLADLDHRFTLLATARRECPVQHSEAHGGYWFVSNYDVAAQVLQDFETFRSGQGVTVPHNPAQPIMPPIDSDPPAHRDWRRVINPHVSPAALLPKAEAMRGIARRLVATFRDRGECDLMGDYAEPFSAVVLAQLILGVDDEERVRQIQRNNHAIASGMDKPEGQQAFVALRAEVVELIDERRRHPRENDLVTSVINATIEGASVTVDEAVNCMMILYLGGLDTVSDAIGSIGYRIAQNPELVDRVRDERSFRLSVDEFLRLDSPVAGLARTASRDVELAGHTILAGEQVLVSYLSANRDDDQFPAAEHLDFDRQHNRHLAFGLGPHRCVGSHLARLELEVAFSELLSQVDNIRLATTDVIPWKVGLSFGPTSLPIRFDARRC